MLKAIVCSIGVAVQPPLFEDLVLLQSFAHTDHQRWNTTVNVIGEGDTVFLNTDAYTPLLRVPRGTRGRVSRRHGNNTFQVSLQVDDYHRGLSTVELHVEATALEKQAEDLLQKAVFPQSDPRDLTLCVLTPTFEDRDVGRDFMYRMFARQSHPKKKWFVYRNGVSEMPQEVHEFWQARQQEGVKFANTRKPFSRAHADVPNTDPQEVTIGEKRNFLAFNMARGEGCNVFVNFDDDDFYSARYLEEVAKKYIENATVLMTEIPEFYVFQAKTELTLWNGSIINDVQNFVQQEAGKKAEQQGFRIAAEGDAVNANATWLFASNRNRHVVEYGWGWMHSYHAALLDIVKWDTVSFGEEYLIGQQAAQNYAELQNTLAIHLDTFAGSQQFVADFPADLGYGFRYKQKDYTLDTFKKTFEAYVDQEGVTDFDFFCLPSGYPNAAIRELLCGSYADV